MKVSLIATVLNEENSIKKFLDSVVKQTKLPEELVIVDGGSTDSTESVISNFWAKGPSTSGGQFLRPKLKLIRRRCNRSVGRNIAIKNSTGDIIAVSDVGCTLDKNWLRDITNSFENESVDVVAGYYKPETHSIFEKCLATYTCVMPDKVDPKKFLPSSRSVAFRKAAWRNIGGYSEDLDTCEDLVFAKKMKKAGFKFVFAQRAIVYWPQEKNIFQAFKHFFSYAVGDGQALYIRPQTPFLFARYLIGIAMVILYLITKSNTWLLAIGFLLFAYLVWAIYKNFKYVKHPNAFLYLPLLQVVSDAAVLLGTTVGFLKRLMR